MEFNQSGMPKMEWNDYDKNYFRSTINNLKEVSINKTYLVGNHLTLYL